MNDIEQLKYDYWLASRVVAAMRADLAGAEKELSRIADALAVASASARCGAVVVAS